jgi:4-amino-4-deoxy-L-arabinose transferase-like glycosyltransferase
MALLLRIAAITYLGNVYKPLSADGYRYNLIATNLREGRGYTVMGQPDILTGPLYVFFLSAAYFTFGHSYLIIRGLQILMNITSIYLIYRFMRQKSGETPALICALILGLSPYMALKNLTLTTETLSGFINVSFALLLTKAERDGRFFSYCLAGLALGLSVLTRPVSALFPFFYPAAIMIFYRKEIRLKRFAARWLVFLISALTLVAPWATRNYLIFRRPIPATGFSAGLALYAASLNYNRPQPFNTEERKAMISFKTPEEWFSTPADYLLDCERQFFKAALRNIRRHPARFLSSGVFYAIPVLCNLSFPDRDLELRGLIGWFKYRLMRKVASAVKADFKPVLKGAAILTLFILGVCWWLFNLAVFLFGLAGFYIFRKSDSFRAILIILAYALLTHGFFTAARSRYFLPFYPMFLALAVAAAWRLLAKKRRFSKYF